MLLILFPYCGKVSRSDLNQIHTALNRLFSEDGQRIVFWNDPDQEVFMTVSLLELDGVTTLRLDEVGALEAKIRLEREEPNSKFLLYAPTFEPPSKGSFGTLA